MSIRVEESLPAGAAGIQDRQRLVEEWRQGEIAGLPPGRDRRLVTGLDGERYLFDTRSGLFLQLWGPAEALMEALLAEGEAEAGRTAWAAGRFAEEELSEAMGQCSEVLAVLRGESRK